MSELVVKPLEPSRLTEAYPLVRSAVHVSHERWQSYARKLIAAGGAVLAVAGAEGPLFGLAAYRGIASLRHGRALQVELIVAFELSRLAPVRRLLRDALEVAARADGCDSIIYTLGAKGCLTPRPERRPAWRQLGGDIDTIGLVRRLGSATPVR